MPDLPDTTYLVEADVGQVRATVVTEAYGVHAGERIELTPHAAPILLAPDDGATALT